MSTFHLRYKKKDHNPNIGGLGLGFKEKALNFAQSSSMSNSISTPASSGVSRGPATDRLSAMKAAFKTQYQNQVSVNYANPIQN